MAVTISFVWALATKTEAKNLHIHREHLCTHILMRDDCKPSSQPCKYRTCPHLGNAPDTQGSLAITMCCWTWKLAGRYSNFIRVGYIHIEITQIKLFTVITRHICHSNSYYSTITLPFFDHRHSTGKSFKEKQIIQSSWECQCSDQTL